MSTNCPKAIKRLSKGYQEVQYAENLEKEDKRYAKQNQSASKIFKIIIFKASYFFRKKTVSNIKMLLICREREREEKKYRLTVQQA